MYGVVFLLFLYAFLALTGTNLPLPLPLTQFLLLLTVARYSYEDTQLSWKYLTFRGLCIIIHFYSKTNQMHQCLKLILLE